MKHNHPIVGITICIMSLLLTGCVSAKQSAPITVEKCRYYPTDGKYIRDDAANLKAESLEEAVAKGKRIITLTDAMAEYGEISYMVMAFNRDNEFYHVEMESIDSINIDEERQRLKLDLSAGKGPDLMTVFAVPDANRIMWTGCFADLTDLLEEIGATQEFFFPSVNSLVYNDKIYGVSFSSTCVGYAVKQDVIGGDDIPCFEDFVSMVKNYPKEAIFINEYQSSTDILRYFLEASDSLHGMVNWESGECNFDKDLFYNLLDLCKKYGESASKGYEPIITPVYYSIDEYPGEDVMKSDGWVVINDWFDEGNCPMFFEGSSIMMNANAKEVDGAKAFISYVLSKNGQNYSCDPTNKKMFDEKMQDELLMFENGQAKMLVDPTQESLQEIKKRLGEGRYLPYRINDILDIIYEESEAYFSGIKDIKAVVDVIQNRVEMYLGEQS